MSSNRVLIYIILWGLSLGSCSKQFNKLQKKGTTEEKYRGALKFYAHADYYQAGVLFEEISPLLKGDSTAEKAQFYNAYCNYYQKQYDLSAFMFKNFYSTYTVSQYAEEAFYLYAHSLYKSTPPYNLDQSETLTAVDALQNFVNTYSSSNYTKEAVRELQDLRFRLELKAYEKCKLYYKTRESSFSGRPNYKASVIAIDIFKKEYPDSKFIEELNYIQVDAQTELAELSLPSKQGERFKEAVTYAEKFIDKYTESQYLNKVQALYSQANSSLRKILQEGKSVKR